jgi:RimJ/RimL family protein N-acetyltransferase
MKTLRTNRLILKTPSLKYLCDFYSYARKPNIGPAAGWSPHANINESEFILQSFIESKTEWAIIHKKDKKMIGTIGIRNSNKSGTYYEVGYVLDDIYWGQGLMTEGVLAVLKYLFINKKQDKVYCGYFENNIRSARVQEKLGFKFLEVFEHTDKQEYTHPCILNVLTKDEYLKNIKEHKYEFRNKI